MINLPLSSEGVKPTLSLIATLFIVLGYSYFQNRDLFGLYCLIAGISIYVVKILLYHYLPGGEID